MYDFLLVFYSAIKSKPGNRVVLFSNEKIKEKEIRKESKLEEAKGSK